MISTLEGFTETFRQSPKQIGLVRKAVQAFLDGCPATEDVTLVVDELATDAVLHRLSRFRPFTVRIERHDTSVQFEVRHAGGPCLASIPDDHPRPYRLDGDLVRPHHRIPDPNRQVPHPRKFLPR